MCIYCHIVYSNKNGNNSKDSPINDQLNSIHTTNLAGKITWRDPMELQRVGHN